MTMTQSISAEVHSDDHVIETTFDASRWFAQASDDEILKLARCGWGGDYPADDVALFAAGYDADVKKVFDYLELVGHKKDRPGFECHVNEDSAREWLEIHRPNIQIDAEEV